MATSPSKQKRRDAHREAGLCIHCDKPALPAPPGHKRAMLSYCEDHRKSHAVSAAKMVKKNVVAGLCHNAGCSNTPAPGNNHCDNCNKKSADRTQKRRQAAVAAGKCSYCDKPHLPGITRCEDHNEQLKKSNDALAKHRVRRGICGRCGKRPVVGDGYRRCQVCIDEGVQRHAALKLRVMDAYGGARCVGCGDTEVALLNIDHINGGGYAHALKLGNGNHAKGRSMMYRHLRDEGFPPGFRVLCIKCNIRALRKIEFPLVRFARLASELTSV